MSRMLILIAFLLLILDGMLRISASFLVPPHLIAGTLPINSTLADLPTAGVYGPARIDIIETDKLCVFVSRMPGIGPANIQVMQKSGLLSASGGCQ